MLVNLTQYRGIVGAFNNRSFSFEDTSNFKDRINGVAISHAALIRENIELLSYCNALSFFISN